MKVQKIQIAPKLTVPSSKLPLLIFQSAFEEGTAASDMDEKFSSNQWQPQWRHSMLPQFHYHSTTHECLGIFQGQATLQFGATDDDPSGHEQRNVTAGDVLVIPAGCTHRLHDEKGGFCMIGAYPKGSEQWDINYGRSEEEKRTALKKIEKVPVPTNPLTGEPLLWDA